MKQQILFAACLCFLLSSCLSIKPIEFKRTENFFVSSNNKSPVVNFMIVFYNPNSFGCSISYIESEGTLKDQLVFVAEMKTRTRAKSKTEFFIPVNAYIGNMDIGQLLGAGLNLLLNDEAIPMEVKGKIRMRKYFFTKTYYFDFNQAIDKSQIKKLF